MPRVLIADKMDGVAAEIFKSRGIEADTKTGLSSEDLAKIIGDYDGIAVRSTTKIGADVLANPGALKVIGRAGIGVDTVDVEAATRAGVVVMNTPFGNSVTTAEHTVAMMMALARSLPQANASTHTGKWEKSAFMGVELMGKTLGLIGCGNIGGIVARRAIGLEMKVMAFDPFLTEARAFELGVQRAEFDDVLKHADFISIHTPMTDKTRGMIDAAAMTKMKKGVRLINCARGGLIVEKDLHAALDAGQVAGAALDVFETEPATENILFGHKNVICTPHLGASTSEAQVNVARQIAEQMSDYLLNGAVQNAVNMPAISADEAPRLRPFMNLAETLGTFVGQMSDTAFDEVRIEYQGRVVGMNIKALSTCVLAAVLKPVSSAINMVNAFEHARSNGMTIHETTTETCADFGSAIKVTIKGAAGTYTVMGTLFAGRNPRLVNIDGVDIEGAPASHMLLIRNHDKPGMIGALGSLLGDAGFNIADFRLGRVAQGGSAIALVTLDIPLSEEVMVRVRQIPQIQQVQQIRFN